MRTFTITLDNDGRVVEPAPDPHLVGSMLCKVVPMADEETGEPLMVDHLQTEGVPGPLSMTCLWVPVSSGAWT